MGCYLCIYMHFYLESGRKFYSQRSHSVSVFWCRVKRGFLLLRIVCFFPYINDFQLTGEIKKRLIRELNNITSKIWGHILLFCVFNAFFLHLFQEMLQTFRVQPSCCHQGAPRNAELPCAASRSNLHSTKESDLFQWEWTGERQMTVFSQTFD